MKKGASQNFTLPEEFPSIEDAEVIPGEECPVANIGEVEDWGDEVRHWVSVEYSEKVRIRAYITLVILVIWVAWTIVGLIRIAIMGDSSVLIASPALLSVPLYRILKFYYTNR